MQTPPRRGMRRAAQTHSDLQPASYHAGHALYAPAVGMLSGYCRIGQHATVRLCHTPALQAHGCKQQPAIQMRCSRHRGRPPERGVRRRTPVIWDDQPPLHAGPPGLAPAATGAPA